MKKEDKSLTVRERKFLKNHIEGMNQTEAYLAINSNVSYDTARVKGSQMMKRVRDNTVWKEIMIASGLDEMCLLQKLKQLLETKKIYFWQGKVISGSFDDALIQIRALELLCDLHGKRKNVIELGGKDGIPFTIKYEIMQPETD